MVIECENSWGVDPTNVGDLYSWIELMVNSWNLNDTHWNWMWDLCAACLVAPVHFFFRPNPLQSQKLWLLQSTSSLQFYFNPKSLANPKYSTPNISDHPGLTLDSTSPFRDLSHGFFMGHTYQWINRARLPWKTILLEGSHGKKMVTMDDEPF